MDINTRILLNKDDLASEVLPKLMECTRFANARKDHIDYIINYVDLVNAQADFMIHKTNGIGVTPFHGGTVDSPRDTKNSVHWLDYYNNFKPKPKYIIYI